MPQQHVAGVWKTLLYHVTEDGLEAMRRGEEPTDAASSVFVLTFQLINCFLSHVAVIDQSTTTAATRTLLPDLMTQTCEALQQVAALVTRRYQSSAHLGGLLSACLAWRRLQSALLAYCDEYRQQVASALTRADEPLAPDKRWTKLAKLDAAGLPPCSQLMADLVVEAARVAPPDWQPPSGANQELKCADVTIKQQAKSLSSALPRLLARHELSRLPPAAHLRNDLPDSLVTVRTGSLVTMGTDSLVILGTDSLVTVRTDSLATLTEDTVREAARPGRAMDASALSSVL
ncbi:uncharacterized protein LOC119104767 [Pollicipes pollicipes]|uniref:uncharacterized protein LOC119104767 n=1 Tax=Pollicipes pollicipes TaxID=41117 RepID=UPI0018853D54|nr:uncharacterized protein LOC119104767 [Pollicipes pollicipes]